jgi:hypothetical protein
MGSRAAQAAHHAAHPHPHHYAADAYAVADFGYGSAYSCGPPPALASPLVSTFDDDDDDTPPRSPRSRHRRLFSLSRRRRSTGSASAASASTGSCVGSPVSERGCAPLPPMADALAAAPAEPTTPRRRRRGLARVWDATRGAAALLRAVIPGAHHR